MSELRSKLDETIKRHSKPVLDVLIEDLKKRDNPIVIFGVRRFGKRILEVLQKYNITVSCYCDNFCTIETVYGLPCISFEILKKDFKNAYIIIASDNYYQEIKKQLIENNFNDTNISPFMFVFNLTMDEVYENIVDWEFSYNIFEDDISREVVISKICHFLFNDPMYITSKIKDEREYFDSGLLDFTDDEVYVDGGVFDGQTILSFIDSINGKYRKIYGFELDSDNYAIANKRLNGYNNIELINKGLWKEEGHVRYFKNKYASANSIINNSLIQDNKGEASLTTIDIVCITHPTFIKLDIEGSEFECLEGASMVLKTYKPKLAICAYHKSDDYIKLPKKIFEINPQYKLYMRHFTANWLDSIIFAR